MGDDPVVPTIPAWKTACPNNPGRQCVDYDETGKERSGRCVYKCAIDNDRDAAQVIDE